MAMATEIDAVIAALREILREAEHRTYQFWWSPRVVNRWIALLPGTRFGRWRNLRIGVGSGDVSRADLVAHLRATIAYLEINRGPAATVALSPSSSRQPQAVEPKVVDVEEASQLKPKRLGAASKKARLIN